MSSFIHKWFLFCGHGLGTIYENFIVNGGVKNCVMKDNVYYEFLQNDNTMTNPYAAHIWFCVLMNIAHWQWIINYHASVLVWFVKLVEFVDHHSEKKNKFYVLTKIKVGMHNFNTSFWNCTFP